MAIAGNRDVAELMTAGLRGETAAVLDARQRVGGGLVRNAHEPRHLDPLEERHLAARLGQ